MRDRLSDRFPVEGQNDLCVSAPTGSGKTLAYTLPIVEFLRTRKIGRLGALVVVPTRDLVGQVEETFCRVEKGFSASESKDIKHRNLTRDIDYLVITPGKLIDRLPYLDLTSLKYLVVDEADRLLDQSFQEWLPHLLDKIEMVSGSDSSNNTNNNNNNSDNNNNNNRNHNNSNDNQFDSGAWKDENRVQKLLFSATLTKNPAKISQLNLYRPIYVTVRDPNNKQQKRHFQEVDLITPEGLKELMVVFEGLEEMKPGVLLEILTGGLILDRPIERILCFTGSISSTLRLTKLLEVMMKGMGSDELRIVAFHAGLSDGERVEILKDFNAGRIGVLIGSDGMARGLDLKHVTCVINYDLPKFGSTYVHRVGRTARAGLPGLALTILPTTQMRHFKKLLRTGLHKTIRDFDLSSDLNDLKWNQVGKAELARDFIESKWREPLMKGLKELQVRRRRISSDLLNK